MISEKQSHLRGYMAVRRFSVPFWFYESR